MRRSRRWLAGPMMLGLICAQFISLAHACMMGSETVRPLQTIPAQTAAMPADCAMMVQGPVANDSACDTQCFPRDQADRGADVRLPSIAPPRVLIVRVAADVVSHSALAPPPLARIASPPLSLLFSRFLI